MKANVEAEIDALLKKHTKLINLKKNTCAIGKSKRRPFIEALFTRDLSATAIYRIMQAEGETASYPSYQRHRRGGCECER